jgi:hypothetical protein
MAWALGFVLLVVFLAQNAGLDLERRRLALYALFLFGPVLSAGCCSQAFAVLLGTVGLSAGVIAAALFLDFFGPVEWGQTIFVTLLIWIVNVAVSIPVWWYVRRLRVRTTTIQSSS